MAVERAGGMVQGMRVRALWPCGSDAPRIAGVRPRLGIERPLAAPPERPRSHPRNRRFGVLTRVDQGRRRRRRAVRADMLDCRSNAPGIALGRALLAENQPDEARPAMSPPCPPCQYPRHCLSRSSTALCAQEKVLGWLGSMGRVLGRLPGGSAAACWPVMAIFEVGRTPFGPVLKTAGLGPSFRVLQGSLGA